MMNDGGFDFITFKNPTKECLLRLIEHHKITLESISKIVELDLAWLTDFVDGKVNINDLPLSDRVSLEQTVMMLADSAPNVDEDTRIKAVIEVLESVFGISHETIAVYAKIELEELERFMADANSLSYEKRYKLATASLFLHYLLKKPPKGLSGA